MSIRQRTPLPDSIKNAPQLLPGLQLFYVGFLDLCDERQIGFGEGPIPWRARHEYCLVHDIDGEQRDDFLHHIKHLDAAYLKFKADSAPKGK